MANIRETTPIPVARSFEIEVNKKELLLIQRALNLDTTTLPSNSLCYDLGCPCHTADDVDENDALYGDFATFTARADVFDDDDDYPF